MKASAAGPHLKIANSSIKVWDSSSVGRDSKARCKERFKRSRSVSDRCRVAMLRKLNDDHTSTRLRHGAFSTSVGQHREFHCFFPARMARRSSASHLDFRTETRTRAVTEKTGRKKDETAFEIERCARHRAERA